MKSIVCTSVIGLVILTACGKPGGGSSTETVRVPLTPSGSVTAEATQGKSATPTPSEAVAYKPKPFDALPGGVEAQTLKASTVKVIPAPNAAAVAIPVAAAVPAPEAQVIGAGNVWSTVGAAREARLINGKDTAKAVGPGNVAVGLAPELTKTYVTAKIQAAGADLKCRVEFLHAYWELRDRIETKAVQVENALTSSWWRMRVTKVAEEEWLPPYQVFLAAVEEFRQNFGTEFACIDFKHGDKKITSDEDYRRFSEVRALVGEAKGAQYVGPQI